MGEGKKQVCLVEQFTDRVSCIEIDCLDTYYHKLKNIYMYKKYKINKILSAVTTMGNSCKIHFICCVFYLTIKGVKYIGLM